MLEEAGLTAALRSVAQEAAKRGDLALELDLRHDGRHALDRLLFTAARELLSNAVEHAHASRLRVRLLEICKEIELAVEDDGCGFPPERLAEQLADGHVGLASQRVRIEAAGGSLRIVSPPGTGTRVAIRLPA